ncbi:hypothetical protein GS421_03120 [Rhodococcus hoagii]|nr:hypothetical protein [Prescottella equi]
MVTDIGSVALPVVWGAMQIGIGILGDVANAIGESSAGSASTRSSRASWSASSRSGYCLRWCR